MPATRKTLLQLSAIRLPANVPFKTAAEHREALSLIQRLAESAQVAIADLPMSAATLDALTGGRSAARVFKLTPFFGPRRQAKGPPVILKIAPRLQGNTEKSNYDKFVRWALPVACRPELLGFGRTRAYSGLCYSLVGGGKGAGTNTLTQCLQQGDATKVDLVLGSIFNAMRDTWYSAELRQSENDIARRYLRRYFDGQRSTIKAEAILQTCAARYFKARPRNGLYVIGDLSFPSPLAILFTSRRKRPYRSCILHGDLNSDNIVIAENPAGAAIVDFQKTGRGHVYEDLVAVEASMRINYPKDASFYEILEKERLIALGKRQPRRDAYTASIRKIRSAALCYFDQTEEEANYHFAVAAIGLRLMLAVDLTPVARARITASVLWATKALAGEM